MASALKLDGVRQTVDGAELAVRIDFVDAEDITADQLDVHIDDHAVSLAVAGAAPVRSEVNSELNFPSNFEGLVLGCIDADFCK